MSDDNNEKQERMAKAALMAFFNIADKWELSVKERLALLGNPEDDIFQEWHSMQSADDLPQDTLERISYLMGIYKALHVLLPSEKSANSWVRKPNDAALFDGGTALDLMMSGDIEDLAIVRRHLDAERI